jgi:hypothetical protein
MTDPSPETFAAVADLIKLVVDAKACAKRVEELAKLSADIATAQAKLDAAQPIHDQKAAELEAREISVTERERIVAIEEAEYFRQKPKERFPLGMNGEPGTRSWSGLTREAE